MRIAKKAMSSVNSAIGATIRADGVQHRGDADQAGPAATKAAARAGKPASVDIGLVRVGVRVVEVAFVVLGDGAPKQRTTAVDAVKRAAAEQNGVDLEDEVLPPIDRGRGSMWRSVHDR